MKWIYSFLILVITPAIALASQGDHSGSHMVWRVIDFILFAGIIVYLVRKPIVNYFKNRKKQVIQEVENAKKAKEDALIVLGQTQDKLSKLSSEIENIIKIYTQMGEKEKEDYAKAVEAFEELSKKRIDQEKAMILNKAYKEYIGKIVALAINKAKENFENLSQSDLQSINQHYIKSLEVSYDK